MSKHYVQQEQSTTLYRCKL